MTAKPTDRPPRLAVELTDDRAAVRLVLVLSSGAGVRVPLMADTARALASQLLGAAAAADPAGHDAMLSAMATMLEQEALAATLVAGRPC